MAEAAQEFVDGKRTPELLNALGANDWTLRAESVIGLTALGTDDTIDRLLEIVREGHRDLSRLNAALQILTRTSSDVVPALNDLLRHPDREVRAYVALTLGDRGDPRAISPLVAVLSDRDINVRTHAVEALGKLRAAAAVDKLWEYVKAGDFELAFPAIDALIAIGDQRIANALPPLLRNPLLKAVAVQALGALGDEEVLQPLLDTLADPEVPAADVATALVRVHQRYQRSYGDERTIPTTIQSLVTPENIQALVTTVQSMSSADRVVGAVLLSWLPGSAADIALAGYADQLPIDDEVMSALVRKGAAILPKLLSSLSTVNDEGRKAIIEAAARIGDQAAVPALLELIGSEEDEEVLVRAFDALARLGDAQAYEPLREFFGHRSGLVRQAAAAAVNSLAHPNTAADLLAGLQDPAPRVRESTLRVAAYLGPPHCLDALLDCCDDADPGVRRAAVESLPTFDDPRVSFRLAQAIRSDTPAVRAAAISSIAKLEETPEAASLLADSLRDPDVWVRYFTIRSLQSINGHIALTSDLIELAMNDNAMQVRLAAVEALGNCGDSAVRALLELQQDSDVELAGAALAALGKLTNPDAQTALAVALHSPDIQRRIHAARALASNNHHEAVNLLRHAACGNDDRLASEAIAALGQTVHRGAASALVQIAAWPTRREQCIAVLVSMADAAIPELAHGLSESELDQRRAIVESLSRIGSPAAIEVLELSLSDAEPSVRFAALASLAHLRNVPRTTGSPASACEGET